MHDDTRRPRSVGIAAAIVGAEGVAIVGLALAYVGLILVGTPHNRGLALFGAALGLLLGAGLLVASRGLRACRRAAYSPILLTQLIAVPVGIGLVQGHRAWIAVLVLVPSVVVLALLLFTPGGRSVVANVTD
jgi:hypothetical protein